MSLQASITGAGEDVQGVGFSVGGSSPFNWIYDDKRIDILIDFTRMAFTILKTR